MTLRVQSGFRATRGARFLDPSVLARIDNLELLARTVVDGFLHGLHRSPHLGLSLDFAEHRSYMPGDDIRRIDWKLYARTDRYYVKQFEAETSANFLVLVDVSASMRFGSHQVSKLDYARYLAACLTFLSQRQRDRVGCATFDQDVVAYVPPSTRHLELVLHALDTAEAGRAGSLVEPLARLGEKLSHRGIVVLVSDFYEEPERVMEAVKYLRFRGQDLIVFHVLDPVELAFPFESAASFRDLESGDSIPVVAPELADEYRALVRAHCDALSEGFTARQVDYTLLDTSQPLDHALFRYLSVREKAARVR